MKKLLALLLISAALFSFSACGKTETAAKDQAEPTQEATESVETAQGADENISTETKAETNDKEDYWATENKDAGDVWYHKKDCDMIKDKSPDVLPWEIINTIGMTACEKCNP